MRASYVIVAAMVMAGCAAQAPEATSGLEIPLVRTQPDGTVYRLSGTFEFTEEDGTVHEVDASGDAPAVELALDPGIVQIELRDGWGLARSTDAGATFTAVPAILASLNPVNIRVVPNRTRSFEYDFIVREATGELRISFGVIEAARQLSGAMFFEEGTGVFAPYAGGKADFTLYFEASAIDTVIEADGTHDRTYFSFLNALEFFNDEHGQLAGLASKFAGGSLDFTNRVLPDGSQDFAGSYQSFQSDFRTLTFETGFLDARVGADGFPVDASFVAFGVPFSITSNDGTVVLRGQVSSMREFQ